jgi:hypothetical protein
VGSQCQSAHSVPLRAFESRPKPGLDNQARKCLLQPATGCDERNPNHAGPSLCSRHFENNASANCSLPAVKHRHTAAESRGCLCAHVQPLNRVWRTGARLPSLLCCSAAGQCSSGRLSRVFSRSRRLKRSLPSLLQTVTGIG